MLDVRNLIVYAIPVEHQTKSWAETQTHRANTIVTDHKSGNIHMEIPNVIGSC